jgi:ABC-type nitrate/sulfonate/bicarbonate transport system substrate-binding protein
MTLSRRRFLKAAAAGIALGAPAVARAQGTKGKVRLAYLQLGWAGTEIIHKEDLLGKRGWQAEYSVVPGSPVPLLNQLTSKNVDAIDMSFALAAKAFEDGAPLKVTGVATAVLGAIVARTGAGIG